MVEQDDADAGIDDLRDACVLKPGSELPVKLISFCSIALLICAVPGKPVTIV